MTDLVVIIFSALVFCFGFVLAVGAPYLPTLQPQVKTALQLLDLKPGQVLLELGCGDGKVLIAAARQGLKAVGYELNPVLVLLAWARTRRYRRQVRVVWGNFWRARWPECEGIFAFALPRLMPKLHKKITQEISHPVKLVSVAFNVPQQKAARTLNGVSLYKYQ